MVVTGLTEGTLTGLGCGLDGVVNGLEGAGAGCLDTPRAGGNLTPGCETTGALVETPIGLD